MLLLPTEREGIKEISFFNQSTTDLQKNTTATREEPGKCHNQSITMINVHLSVGSSHSAVQTIFLVDPIELPWAWQYTHGGAARCHSEMEFNCSMSLGGNMDIYIQNM